MIKRIKEILGFINEATLDQVVDRQREQIINTFLDYQGYSDDIKLNDLIYDYEYPSSQEIMDELREKFPKEMDNLAPNNTNLEDVKRYTDLDDSDIVNTDAFKEQYRDFINQKIDRVIYDLEDIESNGHVTLYRSIGIGRYSDSRSAIRIETNADRLRDTQQLRLIPKEYGEGEALENYLLHLEKEGKHLGIFWADSYEKAEEFGDNNQQGFRFIFEIEVPSNQINWFDTIILRLDPVLGDEKEVRLFKNTKIRIEKIYSVDSGDIVDITNIKDKTFYA